MSTVASGSTPRPRLRSSFLNRVIQHLPPITETDENWTNVQPLKPQKQHYRLACLSILSTVIIGGVMIWQLPFSRFSIITAAAEILMWLGVNDRIAAILAIVVQYVLFYQLVRAIEKVGGLNNAALREEEMFRVGSENWNWLQRLKANFLFGAIHLMNLFVPLAAVIGLSTGGWWFMWVYRKTYAKSGSRVQALQQSAAVHSAHNELAFKVLLPLVLVFVIVYALVTIF